MDGRANHPEPAIACRMLRRVMIASSILGLIVQLCANERAQADDFSPAGQRLLIAYGSYKDRGKYPTVTFYEHDGHVTGKVVSTIPPANLRSDSHPSLSHDGRLCAFTSEVENQTSRILLWDMNAKQLVDHPLVNDSPNSQQHAALSGNGRVLAFAAWNRPGAGSRWDILCYEIESKSIAPMPRRGSPSGDVRMPAMSVDGVLLAYVSGTTGSSSDVCLRDRRTGDELLLPGLNSSSRDVEPTLSADGRWIAFASDRPGGAGGRDIYLYDRDTAQLIALPNLNSAGHEQSPSISQEGRYIAFVSERRAGAGERDIFVYDRANTHLVKTPDLNSAREEIDPCIVVLPVLK